MNNKIILWCALLLLSMWGCKPKPFQTALVGYSIQFPISMTQLQKQYPNGYKPWSDRFIDSTQTVRAEWWSDNWRGSGNNDLRNEPYGIGIFLKNKANQFDSVKTALEKKYGKPLLHLNVTELGKYEPYQLNPPVYVCHPNENVILVLSEASSLRGDPWSQYNSVRISIGYNLSETEEERFATRDGRIHEDI